MNAKNHHQWGRVVLGLAVLAAVATGAVLLLSGGGGGEDDGAGERRAPKLPPVSKFEDSGPPRTPAERRRREKLVHLQRPVTAPVDGGDPIEQVEHAITREAQRRTAAGESDKRVRRTVCDPARELEEGALATTCVAATSAGSGVIVGAPYVALVEPERGRATFCERTPTAGEGAGSARVRVALAPPCRRALLGS